MVFVPTTLPKGVIINVFKSHKISKLGKVLKKKGNMHAFTNSILFLKKILRN
jgi:hypothetical protein